MRSDFKSPLPVEDRDHLRPLSLAIPDRPLLGVTVLVVEDSRFASEAMRLLCLKSGARIRRADSLSSARKHLKSYRPHVMIVDLGLPDGSGSDLIRISDMATPRVPVILGLSGDPDNESVALDAGADSFLAKPVDSLACFQQVILQRLSDEPRGFGLRALPDDIVTPDKIALRDDFIHVMDVLSSLTDGQGIEYIINFLSGVARSAHDHELADAARDLAQDHEAGNAIATDLVRISSMVEERLTKIADA